MKGMRTSILNGRLIDPANDVDEILDVHIAGDRVAALGTPPQDFTADRTIDATNKVVCPGLIDLSANLREPGFEHKATIASETEAAAAGGITTLICSPATDPVIDTPAVWELIRRRAKACARTRVLAQGALTRNLDGEQLSEMAALKAAGCVGLGNSCKPLASTLVERRALEYASTFDMLVFLRPEDHALKSGGCVHEGMMSTRLGLPGIPTAAESVAVARDLMLASHTGARIHFQCLSSAAAVKLLSACDYSYTADVAAHQLHLTEMDVDNFDSQCHLSPPLRTLADRDALRQAIADGTINAICSDHQPHDADAKEAPFSDTSPGLSGLETLLPLTLRLVEEGVLDLATAIARLTSGPAKVLGLPLGQLGVGAFADICIFDPDRAWPLYAEQMISSGHNTPFDGWEFRGCVTHTLFEGQVVYDS